MATKKEASKAPAKTASTKRAEREKEAAAIKPPVGDVWRTKRAKEHLQRLEEQKGKRLLVDLDAEGSAALSELLASGYGATNRAVVNRALIAARKRAWSQSV